MGKVASIFSHQILPTVRSREPKFSQILLARDRFKMMTIPEIHCS